MARFNAGDRVFISGDLPACSGHIRHVCDAPCEEHGDPLYRVDCDGGWLTGMSFEFCESVLTSEL
ncbi:hypothetical protein [Azospirillum aestuarii]|uniref:hypothetical protein n=1 Tax=Azospirillum aestuarii TaxID=2802052 RepID=UPI0040551D3C